MRAVATDKTNNTNTSLVASRRVDNTAPATTIDATPTDPSNDTTPTFSLQLLRGRLDLRMPRRRRRLDCVLEPRDDLGALGAGSHTFDVRATDAAGNTDATPASHTWTIDLTAPDTTIDAQPADPSSDTTPTFAFSSSEPGSTFECRIDGGSWTSCSSPDTISPALTEGSHTFDARAVDAAGNTDASPASYTWAIDLTAPDTTIDASPADPSERHHPELHVQLLRDRARPSNAASTAATWTAMHQSSHARPGARRRQPHVRGSRDGRRGQTPTPLPPRTRGWST